MSDKPELPDAQELRWHMEFATHPDEDAVAKMVRAQHEALREPWCREVSCDRGWVQRGKPVAFKCLSCNGTGLNRRARAVFEVGEAAGLGEAKEEG